MTLSSMLPWVRRVKEHSAQARDFFQVRHPRRRRDFCPFNDGGGRGCRKFIPVLVGDGTKIVPPGDVFDQPPGEMS